MQLSIAQGLGWLRVHQRTAETRALAVFVVVGGGLWALIHLGGEMREGDTAGLDRSLIQMLRLPGQPHQPIGPPWLPDTLRDVTALGGATLITLATTLAAVGLVYRRHWRRALVLAVVVALANASDNLLKVIYHRDRPGFAVPGLYLHTQSFPSGHSTASAALWLTLAAVAASFERRPDAKVFWFAMAVVVILAVGFSRVYLGAHWPSDVLAGWILGALWALVGWAVWRGLPQRWRGVAR